MGRDRFILFLNKECLPLVEIRRDDSVRLVHTTVAQYLLGENIEATRDGPMPLSSFQISPEDAQGTLAITCVAYSQVTGSSILYRS